MNISIGVAITGAVAHGPTTLAPGQSCLSAIPINIGTESFESQPATVLDGGELWFRVENSSGVPYASEYISFTDSSPSADEVRLFSGQCGALVLEMVIAGPLNSEQPFSGYTIPVGGLVYIRSLGAVGGTYVLSLTAAN